MEEEEEASEEEGAEDYYEGQTDEVNKRQRKLWEPLAEREYRDMPTVARTVWVRCPERGKSRHVASGEKNATKLAEGGTLSPSIGSPRVGRTRKRRASRTERSRVSSLTREAETTTKKARATGGKNIKKIREQVARAEGKVNKAAGDPSCNLMFATSTYGREKLPQGRGEGKSGKKRKRQTPMKDTRPLEQREGWQDPEVMRAPEGTTSTWGLHQEMCY